MSKNIFKIFAAVIISIALVCLHFYIDKNDKIRDYNPSISRSANLVYRVYLEGKSIGVIRSKEKFEDYIDREQQAIKDKYHIDKVYAPNDLDIVREYTYDEKIMSESEIYNKIKEIKGSEAFTVNGYEITIEGLDEETEDGLIEKDDTVIYVLDKSLFENASTHVFTAFVDKDDYLNYMNDTQEEIKNYGSYIQNLSILNNVSIVSKKIPAGVKIYDDVDELSQYLLFGDENAKKSYTVKDGDNISDVAFDNKMSIEEFLIANTNFNSKDDLLFPGQIVTLGILSPKFNLVEERYVVEERDINYSVKYQDDANQFVGYEKVIQNGEVGKEVVREVQKYVNGEFKDKSSISSDEIKPSVDKIVVRGTKQKITTSSIGDNVVVPVEMGSWVWPTNPGYYISSGFGWRWGKLHAGLDITGTGYGSPIKAANNGIVVESGYTGTNGNYIFIKHSNGYYSGYAHLAARYKNAGDIVYAGDIIGTMGQSGFATGTHLHFQVSTAYPISSKTYLFLSPLSLY